jgi:hypothetical protein
LDSLDEVDTHRISAKLIKACAELRSIGIETSKCPRDAEDGPLEDLQRALCKSDRHLEVLRVSGQIWEVAPELETMFHKLKKSRRPLARRDCLPPARTVLARPSLGYAVKELAFGLRDETDQQEIELLLAACPSLLKITVLLASSPVLVFTALRKAPTSKLASLAVPFLLSIPEGLKVFASYIMVCPVLNALHFEGVSIDDLRELERVGDDNSGIGLLRQAATRHRFVTLELGRWLPDNALADLTSHSHSSLRRLELEISEADDDTFDVSHLTALESLHLYKEDRNGDYDYGEPDEEATILLLQAGVASSLRRSSMALNPYEEYCSEHVGSIWKFIGSVDLFKAAPSAITTLDIVGTLLDTDSVISFLDSPNRSQTLTNLELDIYHCDDSLHSHAAVARRCHALGIHYRPSPYEFENMGSRYEDLTGPGVLLAWSGGEWEEPNSDSNEDDEDSSAEASEEEETESSEEEDLEGSTNSDEDDSLTW